LKEFRYQKQFGLIFASRIIFGNYQHQYKTYQIMKKTLIIALSCLVVLFAACKKKPVEPTPVDYTANYVGNYMGQFTLTITSMNNSAVSNMSFPIDSIKMDIAKGAEANAITATVTVDNESHQTTGTATADKADFGTVHLVIDKPDQNYYFSLDLKMEGTKAESDTLNIVGSFMGNGKATFPTPQGPVEQIFEEVSGSINGKLAKQ
jgi:hypothetical protein